MNNSGQDTPSFNPPAANADDHSAARLALLLMATADTNCSDKGWPTRVAVGSSPPTSVDSAAATLAQLSKPIQCKARCLPDGLAVTFSTITEPSFLQTYARQVEMLNQGEGVIGSIRGAGSGNTVSVTLLVLGQALEVAVTALEQLQRDYLITMPVSLSSIGLEENGGKWTISAGRVRAVSQRELQELLNTLDRLPPE